VHHDLDDFVSLRVWALAEAFEARLARELRSLDLSVSGFRLVGELLTAPAGLRTGELARRVGVKPPSVTTMVAKLEAAGVVVVVSDPDDARGTRVKLAPRARLGRGLDVLARLDRALVGEASPAARKKLARTLEGLVAHLNEDVASESPRSKEAP
jgi:DNA-binding MarR family transcriptional regulator